MGAGIMLTPNIQNNYQKDIDKLSKVDGVSVLAKGRNEGEGCRGTMHLLHSTVALFLEKH